MFIRANLKKLRLLVLIVNKSKKSNANYIRFQVQYLPQICLLEQRGLSLYYRIFSFDSQIY